MNTQEKMKTVLWGAGAVTLIALAFSAYLYSAAYDRSTAYSAPSISVSATGKVVASPDVVRFSYSVISESAKDITAAKVDNDQKSTKIVEFLKAKGVPAIDIKTTNYSMTPRYQNYACPQTMVNLIAPSEGATSVNARICPPPSIVGYTFNNSVEVTVRDFAKQDLNQLVAGVVTAGANNVSTLRFELDDSSKVRTLAKAEAIRKAMGQARQLAKEGGFSLGRLLSIDEQSGGYYEKVGLGGGMMTASSLAPTAPAIEAGSQEISITVSLRYSLN